ncbi:hypothetical protein CPB85DRAFT_1308221 [Mucidula mucida]|nr:hypothetical protein CPB85DRAFT_1308221 [Mucidula mucida]
MSSRLNMTVDVDTIDDEARRNPLSFELYGCSLNGRFCLQMDCSVHLHTFTHRFSHTTAAGPTGAKHTYSMVHLQMLLFPRRTQ